MDAQIERRQLHVPPKATPALPATMRAIVQDRYGPSSVLRVEQLPLPAPAAGEVLVRVAAAGVDRGVWHLMVGRPYPLRAVFGLARPKQRVPGLDLAGVVVALGPQVERWAVGDVVFGIGRGTYAQFACARAEKLAHAPKNLPLERCGVLAISGLTALQALRDATALKAGERVLVLGAAGGVGHFAVQLARALGAHVTGVCSAAKLDFVRSLGAHEVLDYRRDDFAAAPERFDVIVDIAGNAPLARLRRALAPRGRLAFVGGESGGEWTFGLERQLAGALLSRFGAQRFVPLLANEDGADMARLAARVESGELAPHVERVFALEDAPQALAELEAGRVRGKFAIALPAE
jgi:NADPH:quinone reductase-like Zn-dependent oxidoreductase